MIKRSPKGLAKDGLKTSSVLTKFSAAPEDSKERKEQHKESKATEEEPKLAASKTMKAQHVPWIDSSKAQELLMSPNMNTEVIRLPNTIRVPSQSVAQKVKDEKSDLLKSPSLFLRDTSNKDTVGGAIYCECGNPCDGDNTICTACSSSKTSIEHSGYLYLKAKSTKLKRYWYILLNRELYCKFTRVNRIGYKNKDDAQCKRMHSLAGTFIKDELEDIFDKKTVLYPFSLYFMQNKKTFYALKKEEKVTWMKALKEAIGYSSLYDFYELKVDFLYVNILGCAGQRQVRSR